MYCVTVNAQPSADLVDFTPPNLSVKTTKYFFAIGERKLPVHLQQYGDVRDLVFINMHDDENSSVEATKSVMEKRGGLLIEIQNSDKRDIRFKMRGVYYTFDPNRIFTREGTKQTLEFYRKRKVSDAVIDEVAQFGQWLLRLMPEDAKCIIALHNNTNENFTIKDYLPGNKRNEAARETFTSTEQDGDDLFLTTDSDIYNDIKDAGYNITLQANKTAKDDGSLSIYCGRNNIRYVNCETEHGKVQQYREMMSALIDVLDGGKPGRITYDFTINQTDSLPVNIEKGTKIIFNEQEVGQVSNTGKLQIRKSHPIYSNSDFFLVNQNTSTPVIEIRIDPTREKINLNPQNDRVTITVK
jgi:hypothetical protein